MGVLSRFERKLEQAVSGVFARTFRSAVQPVEISSALAREVDNSAQILSRDRRLVPNSFHVELAPSDYEQLDGYGDTLNRELVDLLREHAADQSYVFTGPVHLVLEPHDDLTTGRFRVRSETQASSRVSGGDPTETAVRRASVTLVIGGEALPLSPPGIVVGRGTDADLRIEDPGVSRRHAEFRVEEAYPGGPPEVSVRDLGSTNGVAVDGKRVTQARLEDGATVKIGTTTLTLRLRRE